MKVFWCGSILTHEGLLRYKGEAPSGSQWSKGLIKSLQEHGCQVQAFSPIWDALFPKGYLLPTRGEYFDKVVQQTGVQYVNLPLLRTKIISLRLRRTLLKEIAHGNKPDVIITYNLYPHYSRTISKIVKDYPDIKWISLILDLDDPSLDNWSFYSKETFRSWGSVFLSWWGYNNAPAKRKLHLDCGWSGKLPDTSTPSKKTIIYAGKLSALGGVDHFLQVIKLVNRHDVEFHFYGKGHSIALKNASLSDTRIKIKGYVTEEELDKACSKATAFVSPRDVESSQTKMVFPSKIMHYLKYRKPILSPSLPGISPEFTEVLFHPYSNDILDWKDAVDKVIDLPKPELEMLEKKVLKFLHKRTWSNLGLELLNFIKKEH